MKLAFSGLGVLIPLLFSAYSFAVSWVVFMLSYRHAYHAGNYADVLKHLVLVRILNYLTQKQAPMFYLESHAGAGAYSLQSDTANKTAEYQRGIARLWPELSGSDNKMPPALLHYLELVARFNAKGQLHGYPGSPWLASQILRAQDRMALCELHSKDFPVLQKRFSGDRRAHCYREDGFAKSVALLPPIEKRGLVLIDPSYEQKEDYRKVLAQIKGLHRRFATGVFALWYPVVEQKRIQQLERGFIASGLRRVDLYELRVAEDESKGMSASGMVVVNPPWTLREEMRDCLPYLQALLSDLPANSKPPGFRVTELVGE